MTPEQIREQKRQYGATRPDMVPAGSVGWCWTKLNLLSIYYKTTASSFSDIQQLWDDLVGHKAWLVIPDGAPYGTPEAMLRGELGITLPKFREELSRRERVLQLARDEAVTALGPAVPAKGGPSRNPSGRSKGSNTTLGKERGAEYLVRRLKRDAPEHAARLAAGEYRSARAAALAAGIVRQRSRVEQALALVAKMTPTEWDDFLRLARASRAPRLK